MELDKLSRLIDLLKQEGVVYAKVGDVELQFGPQVGTAHVPQISDAEEVSRELADVPARYRHPLLNLG